MADDGALGSFLGAQDSEDPADSLLTAGAGLADGMALDQADGTQEARDYLRDARRLLRLQMEHLHEQRDLTLSHLRMRRFSDRQKIAHQLVLSLVATMAAIFLLVCLRGVFQSQSVIVEPFDAPPALATRGLTGKVIAGALLDELTKLQARTHGSAERRSLSNAWTGDIKIQVPQTGVSIGEIDRLLRARFAHDVHIDGSLTQSETGALALTVRGTGVLPRSFAGGPGDLDKLMVQAAEYVYGQSQPGLFASYLIDSERNKEAVAFAQAAFASAAEGERPYLLNAWANALGNIGGSATQQISLYRAARALKPDFWTAYNNIMNAAWSLGDEEGAWQEGERMRRAAGGRPGRAPELDYQNWDTLTWNLQAWRTATVADAMSHAGIGSQTNTAGPAIADIDARLHDPADAELQLQTGLASPDDPTLAAMTHFVHGRLAAEAGDTARALTEMEAFGSAFADPVVSSDYPGYSCWIIPAEEAAGHPDRADAAFKAGGHFVDCYRFHADALAHRGDWAGAQRAYAEAVAIAPDLPAAYYSWGLALAAHGDTVGAITKFIAANRRGPHWADPLKAWGDVLVRQGERNAALEKYDAALTYAPAWAALRHARDALAGPSSQ
jgi:tetratricopeptide (TPR) repeat protein